MKPARREEALESLEKFLSNVRPLLLVSPPRSASTALARSLLNHSQVGPYIHEPCDLYCHRSAPVSSILERLEAGLTTTSLLIKEMTFQLGTGEVGDCFLRNAQGPLVFLIREPALTIESRLRVVLGDLSRLEDTPDSKRELIQQAVEARDYSSLDEIVTDSIFPLHYTGWTDLAIQLKRCREQQIDYRIVKASDFRSRPEACLRELCSGWQLRFEENMLDWSSRDGLALGGLGEQGAWYHRVTQSAGVEPETEVAISRDQLPARFSEHLPLAANVYAMASNDPALISPA